MFFSNSFVPRTVSLYRSMSVRLLRGTVFNATCRISYVRELFVLYLHIVFPIRLLIRYKLYRYQILQTFRNIYFTLFARGFKDFNFCCILSSYTIFAVRQTVIIGHCAVLCIDFYFHGINFASNLALQRRKLRKVVELSMLQVTKKL